MKQVPDSTAHCKDPLRKATVIMPPQVAADITKLSDPLQQPELQRLGEMVGADR
jgi:hypothetical protein